MAPGPKKRNFHTPRNLKNNQISKNDKKCVESNNEVNKSGEINSKLLSDTDTSQKDKYSKRSVENNWIKYDEPQTDPHADSMRGNDFDVLLSYSGGSGTQLKLQDEKEWDDEFTKDLSLDIQDLISAMKCVPFHERIGLQNIFDDKTVVNFISTAKKYEMSYKSHLNSTTSDYKDLNEISMEPVLNIIEEPDSLEVDDDDEIYVKTVTVQDKTEDIINSLASTLSFKTFSENEENREKAPEPTMAEEMKPEAASNDLDFLLSLNISSKVPVKQNSALKNTNVDDWLNSILDD